MDKTYAETLGEPSFDWNRWLDSAIQRKPDRSDHNSKVLLASSWTTCACGNQCAIIPRKEGVPVDEKLNDLGRVFLSDISAGRFLVAKMTLREIEARAAFVIEDELRKLNGHS